MKRISDAVLEIVTNHPMLNFGMHHRLLNLSQVARFIRSAVEAQTQKEVRDSAVLMSLSRLQSKLLSENPSVNLNLDKIAIHSGLTCFTLPKTQVMQGELSKLVGEIHAKGGFVTITEGLNEIMTFLDSENFHLIDQLLSEKPRHVYPDIASVAITFCEDAMAISGTIYQITQQVAFHNIKLIGLTTTQQEINIYLQDKDIRLAFDAIYRRFSKQDGGEGEPEVNHDA
ncbi:MAG: hypothetical protein QNJ97_13275 [Myxococcota bacterium]|nr:hypothetical protein [Myxococcota bacterium]